MSRLPVNSKWPLLRNNNLAGLRISSDPHSGGRRVKDVETFDFDDCVVNAAERFELYKRPGVTTINPKRMRRKITNETWEQIKTGYTAGVNLREIARKMAIPEGTVLAHAKRHGWTQQIQVATRELSLMQSDAITQVQSVPQSIAAILSERKARTKLGLSKFTAEAAEQAAEHLDKLGIAGKVKDVASLHRTLCRKKISANQFSIWPY